jgi:hypothetical protein
MSTLDKIAGLLAMAERSGNENEAQAFLAKAQHLATLTSVDLAEARARIGRRERREQPVSRTTRIGEPGKRANKHLVSLFLTVAHCNDVLVDIARNSTYVVTYGMPSDLDVTEAMWGSLAHQMVGAANSYVATGRWRLDSYTAVVRKRIAGFSVPVTVEKPHTAQTARSSFYRAFTERVGVRLREARDSALAERDVSAAMASPDTGSPPASGETPAGDARLPHPRDAEHSPSAMVLKAKANEIRAFHGSTSKARGSWRGYSGGVAADASSATHEGRRAGSRAQLASPRRLPGQSESLPRAPARDG